MYITNDGNLLRFVAVDSKGNAYHAVQGGIEGDRVNYVRVDLNLPEIDNVTIHRVVKINKNGSVQYNPTPVDINVYMS